MEFIWFWLVAILVAGYVLLDGFDLGAGALHFTVARDAKEREQVYSAIGPFWDGNEVWLLAGGGTLYFAFPALYANAFSGFYLPLMLFLWLLILRGISIESRHLLDHPLWTSFWDVVFAGASGMLALVLGTALGNVIRGVPMDANGEFFLPLWTDFRVSAAPGVFDWYTLIVGITATVALLHHGAWWLAYRTHAPLEARGLATARKMALALAALTPLATWASASVRPGLFDNFGRWPAGIALPLLAVAGLAYTFRARTTLAGFLGSCAYLLGMLTTAVFSLYPSVLPGIGNPGLTAQQAAAPTYGLQVGLIWWIPAFALTLGYCYFLYRRFAGKVDVAA